MVLPQPCVCRARQRKACALDVTLWSEVLAGDDPWMRMLFPVNSLRSRRGLLAGSQTAIPPVFGDTHVTACGG